MKKAGLTFIILMPLYCSAQFEKLTLFTSGSGSFTSQTVIINYNGGSESTQLNQFSITPKVGIFLIDKLLIGPNLGWTISSSNPSNITGTRIETSSLVAGPFVRYYVFQGLYLQSDYTWGASKTKTSSSYSETSRKSSQKGFTVGAGYSFFLNANKSVALDISMLYRKRNQTNDTVNASSYTEYNESGLAIGLGISGFIHLLTTK